jgi:hypothetical protein
MRGRIRASTSHGAIAIVAWVALCACGGEQRATSVQEPACEECPACPEVVAPAEPRPSATVDEEPAIPQVRAGSCDVGWLPSGTTRDLSDDDAEALASAVRDWIAGDGSQVIASERGIVYAKSEDDRGDDPPYPPEAGPLAARACGLGARWLADHLRARFALSAGPDGDGVVCEENVCCSAGMEYVPHARIVFSQDPDRGVWTIDSALFVNEAALGEEYVARNRAFVAAALTRLASRRCGREPWIAR